MALSLDASELLKEVLEAFRAEAIEIPYPRRDVPACYAGNN